MSKRTSVNIRFGGTPEQNLKNFNALAMALTGKPVKGFDTDGNKTEINDTEPN